MKTRIFPVLAVVLSCLVGCGGGSDLPHEQMCHPDTFDCETIYAGEFAHLFVQVKTEMYFYTDNGSISAAVLALCGGDMDTPLSAQCPVSMAR